MDAILIGPKRVVDRCVVGADGRYALTAPRSGWYQLARVEPGAVVGFSSRLQGRLLVEGATISGNAADLDTVITS